MSFITNSRGEKVLRDRLLEIASHDDTIMIKSEQGKGFPVSRFLFNFFSDIILPREADVVLTPLSSDHLDSVIQTLSSEGLLCEEESFTDIVMDNDTIRSNKTLDPMRTKTEKEYGLCEQSELSSSSTCEAVNLNNKIKGMAEDISSETIQALETVDEPSNGKDTTEKNESKKDKKGRPTNYGIERIRKKPGAPLVGPKKGSPIIEWDSTDGKKYIKTITCQLCGKLFNHKKYAKKNAKKNITASYREHYKQHELETTDCGCDNIQFKSSYERNQHWKIVHEGYKYCKLCYMLYASDNSYKLHIENVHQEQMCDQCNFKTSKGSYYLKLHIRTAHEKNEESQSATSYSYTCNQDDCEKKFGNQGLLNAHVNKVHVVSTCRFCNKQVKRLYEHIKTMHSEKKFHCDKCAKAFGFMAKLVEHEKVEHQGLRYFCRYSDCKTKEQEYKESSNRSAHERKKHGAPFKSSQ